ncbi:MAG: acylphosphatase [Ginsengibacter sp.]
MKTAHLQIAGKVQGVFFRARAKEIAEIYKISGWIRNTADGKVEACISGEDTAVEEFIFWCKDGPEKAKVENVLVNYTPVKKFARFEVIR